MPRRGRAVSRNHGVGNHCKHLPPPRWEAEVGNEGATRPGQKRQGFQTLHLPDRATEP